jgi:hypothetical protein
MRTFGGWNDDDWGKGKEERGKVGSHNWREKKYKKLASRKLQKKQIPQLLFLLLIR